MKRIVVSSSLVSIVLCMATKPHRTMTTIALATTVILPVRLRPARMHRRPPSPVLVGHLLWLSTRLAWARIKVWLVPMRTRASTPPRTRVTPSKLRVLHPLQTHNNNDLVQTATLRHPRTTIASVCSTPLPSSQVVRLHRRLVDLLLVKPPNHRPLRSALVSPRSGHAQARPPKPRLPTRHSTSAPPLLYRLHSATVSLPTRPAMRPTGLPPPLRIRLLRRTRTPTFSGGEATAPFGATRIL